MVFGSQPEYVDTCINLIMYKLIQLLYIETYICTQWKLYTSYIYELVHLVFINLRMCIL